MRKLSNHPNGCGQAVPQTSLRPLWTRKQVADALQLCVHSVARYTKAGVLPCIRLNRRAIRYDPGIVEAFIKSAACGGPTVGRAQVARGY